ncbi:hypothetical protein PUN28_013808 [Cardiocondyla obscurior]|uniref:RBD domain-containing protein n=1 Tax=Cardiocondyla obscurior TaxID=286306 RepID=A0AAW2F8C9_9HYME
MLCLKKRRTYSFTQDACAAIPRRFKKDNNQYERSLNTAITTLPRKDRNKEERLSRMVFTVTEDTPADMLTGSMELLVQLPRGHHLHTQRVTVLRSTPMMDLLVQIATTHKLTASSYILQAIGERGLILPHNPNTPIGALDALQVKLLPKQGTCTHKMKQINQPFETTFRLQVHLPRNQLYVSRVSPKRNLGEILDEVCRKKNLDRSKYELRHPVNLEETLDLSLSLQDYHLQEVTLYAKQTGSLNSTLSTQDIMALQKQEERRRQQTKQNVFGFMFKKSKENTPSMDNLGARSVSPARSDETARSVSPLQPPARPQRKRRPAPKPPANIVQTVQDTPMDNDKMTINHSRNSSDSSGYHEASVLSDNPDSTARLPETLPRRSKVSGLSDASRKLAQTSQSSKSLGNLTATDGTLSRGISSTSLSSTGLRKKRAAPLPPMPRPLSSAISTLALERIVDSEESLTSDIERSKPSSDIGAPTKANSNIDCSKVNSDVSINAQSIRQLDSKLKPEITTYESNCIQQNSTIETNIDQHSKSNLVNKMEINTLVEDTSKTEETKAVAKRTDISSETDVLLQKVSDTLLTVQPSFPVPEPLPLKTNYTTKPTQTDVADCYSANKFELVEAENEFNRHDTPCMNFLAENNLSSTTSDINTANLQQKTSASLTSDQLSINDWEYQLPAPPNAFRDLHSPVFDDCDAVTLGSIEAFKETIISPTVEQTDTVDSNNKNSKSTKKLLKNVEVNCNDKRVSKEKLDFVPEIEIDIKPALQAQNAASQKTETDSNLQKEVILELENRIETGTLVQTASKDFDRRNMDNLSTPELAPVDNTLSNFTITTYPRKKSLDIFEEFEEFNDCTKNSKDRFITTFATLSRNIGTCSCDKRNATRNTYSNNDLSHEATNKSEKLNTSNVDCKLEPKIRNNNELLYKQQSFNAPNDKINIQRSKSYISMSNMKYQKEVQEINAKRYEPQMEAKITGVRKATSITDLNSDTLRSNEKFSLWRDNILKNQKEPTKEKQLQSIQVLKSILPQLKNAQQTEENMSKDYNNALSIQRTKYEIEYNDQRNEQLVKTNAISAHKSRQSLESECNPLPNEKSTKYINPPVISLGSWSERPSINVQIKTDTDYKLGKSSTNDNKITVNINGTKNERDIANYSSNAGKNITKHEFNIDSFENAKLDELIAHTATSNFKNRVSIAPDMEKNENKPVVMGIELKRSYKTSKEILKNNENEVDTTPMSFKELTKTFGQHGNFKQKPKHSNINRFSVDCIQPSNIERITNSNAEENDYAWFAKPTNQNDFSFKSQSEAHAIHQNSRAKTYTSVIGINGTNQNLESQNEMFLKCNNAIKINSSIPIVKGFKVSTTDSTINNNQINQNGLSTVDGFNKNAQSFKPPTIPVITGVTLKNTNSRPKSMPVQNPRDMLMESIRNFGGREKLKNKNTNHM